MINAQSTHKLYKENLSTLLSYITLNTQIVILGRPKILIRESKKNKQPYKHVAEDLQCKHQARIRALKITHSLSVTPLYLLFKDHKRWATDTGTVAPTRPVVSAGSGQNNHMSELIAQSLEPVSNTWKGGMEVPSTGDFLDKVDNINDKDVVMEDIDSEIDERARAAQ